MHGVCIVMAKLLNDLLDFLLFALKNGVADDLLKPRIPQRSVYGPMFLSWDQKTILESTLFPPIVELVIQ